MLNCEMEDDDITDDSKRVNFHLLSQPKQSNQSNRYMVDKGKFKGVVDCIVQLVQKDGFKGFLKGVSLFFDCY